MEQDKWKALYQRMQRLDIREDELIEKFILGSGSGGQKINKTHSCVYLKHLPSRLEIKCQKSRSRDLNRYYARQELCDRLEELLFKEKSRRKHEIEKIRRQKRRRSRRAQQKVLKEKKLRGDVKALRQKGRFDV